MKQARKAHEEATAAVEPARLLFDLAVAARIGEAEIPLAFDADTLVAAARNSGAETTAAGLDALHFPVAFPEVFLRERPGFDCILGNPPWEKLQIEEHSFYSLNYPGLRGLQQDEADRELARLRRARPDLVQEYESETLRVQRVKKTLAEGPYPGLTAGRADLYKAFAWRFWQLVRIDGLIGVVLPRKAVEASGMKAWRLALLEDSQFSDVTMLLNSRGWVFDDAEHRYTIALISIRAHTAHAHTVALRGPFSDRTTYTVGMTETPGVFSADDLRSWSTSAPFPLLPTPAHLRVFAKMRTHKGIGAKRGDWDVRGMRELNASDDKDEFEFDGVAKDRWPVYKGESFDLWTPETGTMYAYAEPGHIRRVLQDRRKNQIRNKRSAFFGKPESWAEDPTTLPASHPRIAWRDSTNRTNTRTIVAALVPPETILVHQAYTLFFRRGDEQAESYLLGVICSIPFDWFARQMVETHATVEFMMAAPVPSPSVNEQLAITVRSVAARLAASDSRFADWAKHLGVECESVAAKQRPQLLARLDAAVALLYGLDATDVETVFETFHEGWDFKPRLALVLAEMEALSGKGER